METWLFLRHLLSSILHPRPLTPASAGGSCARMRQRVTRRSATRIPMTHPPAAHETPQHERQDSSPPAPASATAAATAPAASTGLPATAHPREQRRLAVGVGIALAALLFIGAAGVLYLRWATMREPMCIFIVEASTSLRGAEVTVDGVRLIKPHTVVIGRGDRFAIPFYLEYGVYAVRVTLNGATVAETEVDLNEKQPYQRLDLTHASAPPPAPPPAPAPPSTSPSSTSPPLPPPVILPGDSGRESGLSP